MITIKQGVLCNLTFSDSGIGIEWSLKYVCLAFIAVASFGWLRTDTAVFLELGWSPRSFESPIYEQNHVYEKKYDNMFHTCDNQICDECNITHF